MKFITALLLVVALLGSLPAQVYQGLYADSLEIYTFSSPLDSILTEKFIYHYDELGREVLQDHFKVRNRETQIVPRERLTWAYDTAGNLIRETTFSWHRPINGSGWRPVSRMDYQYDDFQNLIERQRWETPYTDQDWTLDYAYRWTHEYNAAGQDTLKREYQLRIETGEWRLTRDFQIRINRFGLDSVEIRGYSPGSEWAYKDSSQWFYNEHRQLWREAHYSGFWSPRTTYFYNEDGQVRSEFHEYLYYQEGWLFDFQREKSYQPDGELLTDRYSRRGNGDSLRVYQSSGYEFDPIRMRLLSTDQKLNYDRTPPVLELHQKRYWYLGALGTPVRSPEVSAVFRIFPNPATDRVTVESAEDLSGSQLVLFDSNGKMQRQRSPAGFSTALDLSDLPAGMYWISLVQGRRVWTRALVVR
ncbi:T9SS type A sorting domain-containing protein [Flavilitoribacter nigricans]|uniref:Secretion system C-terminal sorting domain-containing protein n=1 Tax=Flavilitoribacter nigricans (strain ATCC 23147 / DSM 23189 / NBRC 102662 / NCIMB 1420 / SS-2) TaxID=1122177 RepID=A0A2D0N4K2_FLAN2|nr:T9SS type A sorting domain-containing protein [Flavilitoribacter nigricans]PHN03306.1 hypothetical protein CRP01_28350 [Flavilitoribacter nigricans DSM 23189 = NBRC 102662]